MNSKLKFALPIVAIIGTLGWLAAGGISDTSTYFKTVPELKKMGADAQSKRLRVAGDVSEGSIERQGREVRFLLKWESETIPVLYSGIDPLPDTFKDGAQAVADGKMGTDGVFHASKIQAKCASKYQGKPGVYSVKPNQRASM